MDPWFLFCVVHFAGAMPFMCERHFVSRSDCLEALHSVNEFYIPVCQKGRLETSAPADLQFFSLSKPTNGSDVFALSKPSDDDAMLADLFRVPGGSILCWYPVYRERDVPCR